MVVYMYACVSVCARACVRACICIFSVSSVCLPVYMLVFRFCCVVFKEGKRPN